MHKHINMTMINSKLPTVGTSIFAVMSEMANKYGAINLSQGFPNFEVSEKIIELVAQYMRKGFNQYAPMPGVMILREVIAQKTFKLYGAKYNPETEINITAGATQAIFTSISAIIQKNDEVIVFEPAYDSYVPTIELNGGIPVLVQLKYPDYKINWDEVNNLINTKTKMIIINSPHNPTGSLLDKNDIKKLSDIVQNNDIFIISDEVYEHIIFDNLQHESIAKYPELFDKSIIISSFGKTFHATGWKTGYCLASEPIMREFRKVHQFNVYASNTPVQYALADFLQNENEYLQLPAFYQKKRDFFISLLKNTKLDIIPTKGTYFQLFDFSKISKLNDTELSVLLTQKYKIASIPVSAFYKEKIDSSVLRFCFAKDNQTLEKACEKLIFAIEDIDG